MKTIGILGGSFAGVSVAHRILKQATKTGSSVKVVLVSPNTHMYWSIATPRAILPGQFSDEQMFQSIAEGFKQYSSSQFEFILGSAQSLDPTARKVQISTDSESNKTTTLIYDFLIIATGASVKTDKNGAEIPFKGLASTEATKHALHNIQAAIEKAKTVVIAGAGATGVETAGELGFEYGTQKKIVLLASGPAVLETATPSASSTALSILHGLKVDVKLQTKVTASKRTTKQGGGSGDEVELSLSDGTKLITDLYIPTFGVIPNSSYIPDKYLNTNGFVKVDEYFQVKGLENQHVWAIGDISDLEPPQLMRAESQSNHLARNIGLIFNDKAALPYKEGTRAMALQIGKKAGTGHFGCIRVPGFIISFLKKNLFTERLPSLVNGSAY